MEQTFQGDPAAVMGIVALGVMFILIIMAVALLPTIFYLITLQKALNRCHPRNRTMCPGLVWLMLLPFFGMIWHFFIVTAISNSLSREFTARGESIEPNPGQSVGMAMCILNVCSIIPYLGALSALAALVCWIIYWIQIADFSSRLIYLPQTVESLPNA